MVVSTILRTFAVFLPLSVVVVLALPFNLEHSRLAIGGDVDSIALVANWTGSNPLQEDTVSCLHSAQPSLLLPEDCTYVLNYALLQEPQIFKERIFRRDKYMTDHGGFTRARWQWNTCEISVHGPNRDDGQELTLLSVALTANAIFHKCVNEVPQPEGGVGLIGEVGKGYHVLVTAYKDPGRNSAKNSTASDEPAVSVSKRVIQSQHDSENTVASQEMETRDPRMGSSRASNQPAIALNLTPIEGVAPPRYPVHCFNPLIAPLQPAAASDCGLIINSILLRLFDPTRQLTFGFTDAADINLSKPEYQKWQYAQCRISIMNTAVDQVDTFRMLDVAATARRITMECVISTREKIGGVASVGTEGRGFYIYVGGPLITPLSDDSMLLNGNVGAESFQSS